MDTLNAKLIDKMNVFFLQMVDIYDSSQGLVKIGPCRWSPNPQLASWLSEDDDTILQVKRCVCYTSMLHSWPLSYLNPSQRECEAEIQEMTKHRL